jgi:hypothetical protein
MKDRVTNNPEQNRQLDDLFRQGLSNFRPEPSRDLWKGISRNLWWDEISHFTFTNLSSLLWIGGFAGLAVLVGIIVIATIPQSAVTNGVYVQNMAGFTSSPSGDFQHSNPEPSSSNALLVVNNKEEKMTREPVPVFQNAIAANTNKPDRKTQLSEQPADRYSAHTITPPSPAGTTVPLNTKRVPGPGLSFIEPLGYNDLVADETSDTLRFTSPNMILNVTKGKIPVPSFFSADVGVSPEVAFYKSGSAQTEMNFFINSNLTYHIGRFSVRSGIGAGYVYDDGNYRIEYKSKDSIGYYNTVVAYAISQANPKEIVFITHQTVVYDSLPHIADDRTRNRYTYLQVPLIGGFRLLETKRLGLTVEAGPMISILIGKKEAQPVIELPNATIIRIDNNSPVMNKLNWQLYLGLRLDYQLARSLSLIVEPYYRYYFTPLTAQKEDYLKNPYSFGLGIGVQYNFGRKQH